MELQYEKALEEHNLSVSELNEDALIGIEQINSVLKGINMLQKSGKEVKDKTFKKLKAMDKWVYQEILDQVKGTDKNEDEIPYAEQEVLEEIENEFYEEDSTEETENSTTPENSNNNDEEEEEDEDDKFSENEEDEVTYNAEYGYKIDEELKKVHESGKTVIDLKELKSCSPTSYEVIFENYDDSGDNGVETSNFSLIETEEEVFTLTKK